MIDIHIQIPLQESIYSCFNDVSIKVIRLPMGRNYNAYFTKPVPYKVEGKTYHKRIFIYIIIPASINKEELVSFFKERA